jgi:hypothetical protein
MIILPVRVYLPRFPSFGKKKTCRKNVLCEIMITSVNELREKEHKKSLLRRDRIVWFKRN